MHAKSCIQALLFMEVDGKSSISSIAAYQITSVQAVCTIVKGCQMENMLNCTLHMDAVGEQTLEAAFRIARLQGESRTQLTLLSHRLKLEKQTLFIDLISGFPDLRHRLFRNHDVESLNSTTLKGTDLTLKCFRDGDMRI